MTVAISKALEAKSVAVLCASTGNTSASASAYAARAGLRSIVLIPSGAIALGKLSQALIHGARVAAVEAVPDAAAGAGPGASCAAGELSLFLPLAGVVDLAAERARLGKDRGRAEGERDKLAKKLANPGFRAKAEEAVIAETEERLAEAEAELARLDAALSRIAE